MRSLNKVQLIGNLTRDPELRYTPQGSAVCTFGLATNRYWVTESGEKREEAEFHRIVAWNKLAELCSQLLFKGRRTYIEGRLQTRNWTAQDGTQRQTTEIVISDMLILDSKRAPGVGMGEVPEEPEVAEKGLVEEKAVPEKLAKEEVKAAETQPTGTKKPKAKKGKKNEEEKIDKEELDTEEIPF